MLKSPDERTERFFLHVSKRRDRWGARLARNDPDCSFCDDVRMRWDV